MAGIVRFIMVPLCLGQWLAHTGTHWDCHEGWREAISEFEKPLIQVSERPLWKISMWPSWEAFQQLPDLGWKEWRWRDWDNSSNPWISTDLSSLSLPYREASVWMGFTVMAAGASRELLSAQRVLLAFSYLECRASQQFSSALPSPKEAHETLSFCIPPYGFSYGFFHKHWFSNTYYANADSETLS